MQKRILSNESILYSIKINKQSSLNWLFIPGGPGMGPEYFIELATTINLQGSIHVLDLASKKAFNNIDDKEVINGWKKDLIEASTLLKSPILMGHSFGGMLCLDTPEISEIISKIIILDASPDVAYKECYSKAFEKLGTENMDKLNELFDKNPTESNLRNLFISWAPFYFLTPTGSIEQAILTKNSYYPNAFTIGMRSFLDKYSTSWTSNFDKVVIMGGEHDQITPMYLFQSHSCFDISQKIEIPNASHFPWIENLQFFQSALREIENSFML